MSAGSIVLASRLSGAKQLPSSRAGLFLDVVRSSLLPLNRMLPSNKQPSSSANALGKVVDELTEEYVETARKVASDWLDLTTKHQEQAAALEACVNAFQKAVERLPSHWQEKTFPRRRRNAVFRPLNRIIAFFGDTSAGCKAIDAPSLMHPSFSMVFDSQRAKIKHDLKYRASITGPYGCFRLKDTRDEFDYAVERAEELDNCVQKMVEFLYEKERHLDNKKQNSVESLTAAKLATVEVQHQISSIDRSINYVSETINQDLEQINKAINQFDCLSWCITGLCKSIDVTTSRIEQRLIRLQEIECELSAKRPFRGLGASEQTWSRSTAVIKQWDDAVVQLIAAHDIRAQAFGREYEAAPLHRVDTIAPPIVRRRTA